MTLTFTRCTTPAQVAAIAAANHVPLGHGFTASPYAASVTLGEAVYWWAA